MNTVNILYKGKKVEAKIEKNGRILIKLPERTSRIQNRTQEAMARIDNAWGFTTQSLQPKEEYRLVWLYDDGHIEWCDNTRPEKMNAGNFNPRLVYREFPQNIAQELYEVSQQLREYQEIGMSEYEIESLRAGSLESNLNLLGYTRYEEIPEKIQDLAGYGILGKIGDRLQKYRNFKGEMTQRRYSRAESYPQILQTPEQDEELRRTLEEAGQIIIQDINFMRTQDEYLARGRAIDPTFYKEMSKKIPPEDWEIYSKAVRDTAILLLELNHDLLGYKVRKNLTDCSGLTGEELLDRISRLIDSSEFDKACNIEDRFIISECERLAKDGRAEDDLELEALKRKAMATREEKGRYASRYDTIRAYCYDGKRIKKEREGVSLDD